jgi:hypothetical protein
MYVHTPNSYYEHKCQKSSSSLDPFYRRRFFGAIFFAALAQFRENEADEPLKECSLQQQKKTFAAKIRSLAFISTRRTRSCSKYFQKYLASI